LNEIKSLGAGRGFFAPSKYQKNKLDFTFERGGAGGNGALLYGEVEEIFNKFKHELNMGFKLKGTFNGNFTIEFVVGSFEKTLTSEDINDIWSKIIAHGRKNGLTLKE
jgi:phenylalanyl-tRNA synthetase beta subunit